MCLTDLFDESAFLSDEINPIFDKKFVIGNESFYFCNIRNSVVFFEMNCFKI